MKIYLVFIIQTKPINAYKFYDEFLFILYICLCLILPKNKFHGLPPFSD